MFRWLFLRPESGKWYIRVYILLFLCCSNVHAAVFVVVIDLYVLKNDGDDDDNDDKDDEGGGDDGGDDDDDEKGEEIEEEQKQEEEGSDKDYDSGHFRYRSDLSLSTLKADVVWRSTITYTSYKTLNSDEIPAYNV